MWHQKWILTDIMDTLTERYILMFVSINQSEMNMLIRYGHTNGHTNWALIWHTNELYILMFVSINQSEMNMLIRYNGHTNWTLMNVYILMDMCLSTNSEMNMLIRYNGHTNWALTERYILMLVSINQSEMNMLIRYNGHTNSHWTLYSYVCVYQPIRNEYANQI